MDPKTERMMNAALALLEEYKVVRLTHKSGRVEDIGYPALQDEAPDFLEGAFVESIMCHDPIVSAKGVPANEVKDA